MPIIFIPENNEYNPLELEPYRSFNKKFEDREDATFEELFMDVPLEKCGNASTDTPKEAAARMSQYYPEDKIQKYGVLGIGIELIDLDKVFKELDEQKEAEYERLFPDGMK